MLVKWKSVIFSLNDFTKFSEPMQNWIPHWHWTFCQLSTSFTEIVKYLVSTLVRKSLIFSVHGVTNEHNFRTNADFNSTLALNVLSNFEIIYGKCCEMYLHSYTSVFLKSFTIYSHSTCTYSLRNRPIAWWIYRWTVVQEVAGSIPTLALYYKNTHSIFLSPTAAGWPIYFKWNHFHFIFMKEYRFLYTFFLLFLIASMCCDLWQLIWTISSWDGSNEWLPHINFHDLKSRKCDIVGTSACVRPLVRPDLSQFFFLFSVHAS